MDTLLEQATPQAIITDELCRSSFGKFTEQDMARIARRIARRLSLEAEAVNAYEPLVKALRDARRLAHPFSLSPAQRERIVARIDRAIAALATAESSPEREGGR